jgi:hypothetical protein
MDQLIGHARTEGLVVFAGAGVSMPAPTLLPSWNAVNEAMLEALARRLAVFTDQEFAIEVMNNLIATREGERYFTPDYQAQLIEDECGLEYFRVLQALDTEDRNACHDAIAALAAHHYLAAIVTTNFDRLIERALEAADVPYRVFYDSTHYDALPDVVASGFREPLPVIKVHGSVEVPESMVDTLRQRIKGRPEALERAIRALLARHHVLFAGFSGADLAYDEGYLGLRAAAAENRSFTCLLRPDDRPRPGMEALAQAWGPAAIFLQGTLPEWFDQLLAELGIPIPPPREAVAAADRKTAVSTHADQWAASLGHMLVVAIMAELLESSGRQKLAFDLLRRTLRSAARERDMEAPGYARFNYQLGRRLLERGTFNYEIDWLQGRKVAREGNYSAYTANDCFQCLQRGATGSFLDGAIAWGLYDAYRGMPQQGAARIRTARNQARKAGRITEFIDACRTLGIVYEILMQYADGLDWLEQAYREARRFGDEPRRARLCVELARFLSTKRRMDEAHERLNEGYRVAENLNLDITRLELLSAEGCVLVEERRVDEALARLQEASRGFREAGRRPALARSLIDVCYGSFQARDWDGLEFARAELFDLADVYVGYIPLVSLMMVRFQLWSGNEAEARTWITEAKSHAQTYENPGVIEEVEILAKRLRPT